MRWGALMALSLAFAPMHVEAKSVHKEFSEVWLERDNRYVEEAKEAADRQNAAVADFRSAVEKPPADSGPVIRGLFAAIEDFEFKNARGETLRNFRIHMIKKPSEAKTDLWLQDQMDQVKSGLTEADQKEALAQQLQEGKAEPIKVFAAVEDAARIRNRLRGRIAELTLINQNVGSYYQAKSVETEKRQAFWQALSRAGQAMQANTPRATFTNCSTTGPFTNCMTH